jgi:hypothetical protein
MQEPIVSSERFVVIGMGQLGSLLADLLRARGAQVVGVRRGDALDAASAPERVIVAVGEDDLAPVLASLPSAWRNRVVLVQNELVPAQWLAHGIVDPTVAVVWFEKKKDKSARVVLPTPVAGPWAEALTTLLNDAGLDAIVIERALLAPSLLDKNVYILVSNLAGLVSPPGTTTSALLELPLLETTTRVFADVLAVESRRVEMDVDADTAAAAMMRAFGADPDHVAAGRTARARLARTLARATELGIEVPALREIARA